MIGCETYDVGNDKVCGSGRTYKFVYDFDNKTDTLEDCLKSIDVGFIAGY